MTMPFTAAVSRSPASVRPGRAAAASAGLTRRLSRDDLALLRAHWLRLDQASRHDRFSGGVSDAFLEAQAARSLSEPGVVLGHVVAGAVRAVAELKPTGKGEAEAAFSVEGAFRRRGLASALLRRLVLIARNGGVRTLHVRCRPHNRAMQGLARHHGARLRHEDGDVVGTFALAPATPVSVLHEVWLDGLALPARLLEAGAPGRAVAGS